MAYPTSTSGETSKTAASLRGRFSLIVLVAMLFGAAGWFAPEGMVKLSLLATSTTLLFLAVWSIVASRGAVASDQAGADKISETIEHDPAATILTGADGGILFANDAAHKTLSAKDAKTLAGALQSSLANPGAILFRLETRAESKGSAIEDIVTREGHLRISVHKAGEAQFLWRIERSAESPQRQADATPLPMFTMGRNDAVLFMNPAARNLVGERARTLDRICNKLPLRSGQLNDISTKNGLVSCFAVELEGVAGRRWAS